MKPQVREPRPRQASKVGIAAWKSALGTAFTVTVDARAGVSTGISAAARARTLLTIADRHTTAHDLVRPGHVLPLRARDGGVLTRPGHTEAAVDLTRLAGLTPAGVLCEIVSPTDGTRMARGRELDEFADRHGLCLISVDDVIAYRRRLEARVQRMATTRLPTAHGEFVAHGYLGVTDGIEHMALVLGDLGQGEEVLVRVHSECLTGDVFGSRRCDCGSQLDTASRLIAAEGRGVLIYLRGHEGRGIGLIDKLRAYRLQESGLDTVDANLALGKLADARDYGVAAHILADMGIRSVRLLSNNPAKFAGLREHGLAVIDGHRLPAHATSQNVAYLRTKRDRMGHTLPVELPVSAAR
jgi:3,4-dihydroxy 2-butanone 4-phosphate synthase/GTP cyclohydrolase II